MNAAPKDERAKVVRASGMLVEARPMRSAALFEVVEVGPRALTGEVIRVDGDRATIQVYEDTTGLSLGSEVVSTGGPLRVELGPGLLGMVLDGLGRPLDRLARAHGDFLAPGAAAVSLDPDRRWTFSPSVAVGAAVGPGDVLGAVAEGLLTHRILVPPGVRGVVAAIAAGDFGVWQSFGALEDGTPLTLGSRWPVRVPRPVAGRHPIDRPLITGQRIFDFLFPVAEGGAVAVPGGFGTGKTVIEQSLARWAEADVVVYVGCGERGNEMAELLDELPSLPDPRTGRPLSERTVLVVNTSNMPVAARESSIVMALTIAEYYRDQGLRVAVLADSLSRWAEALREIGSRLREMPGEEGYPTALASRLGKLVERAGRVRTLGVPERTGSVTLIAAISPPGGDFSEPVTQAAQRVAGGLWALDARLAQQRQFPAVSWEVSYSRYADETAGFFCAAAGEDWPQLRKDVMALLQQERELREVAELVGQDALEDADRLVLESARLAREVVLGQSAFDPNDASSPLPKTRALARLALAVRTAGNTALAAGTPFEALDIGAARRAITGVRDAPAAALDEALARADAAIAALAATQPTSRGADA